MLELSEAREMVKEILLSDPEASFPIEHCVYFSGGAPKCAVGHVFSRIGITSADLEPLRTSKRNPNTATFLSLTPVWYGKISAPAAEFLAEVQQLQDVGTKWGDVYEDFFGEANADTDE